MATATAEPLDEPPLMRPGAAGLSQAPYGVRVPASPVANWSRFVLPTTVAPAAVRRSTTGALRSRSVAKAGQPAVVGRPATSMLSFTARRRPDSGRPVVSAAETSAATSSSGGA